MEHAATLRLAVRADAPAIAALSRDRIEQGLGWSWTTPRVLRSIADPSTNVVVAVEGDGPLHGFGLMKYLDDDAHLLLLAVDAGAGRRGIGAALLAWLEQSARVAGVARITLEARLDNLAALAFYARAGYRRGVTLPGYYRGVESAVRLSKGLRPAMLEPGWRPGGAGQA
jgi:[ribosomal protein S18]-alanine N-acetyltransferase